MKYLSFQKKRRSIGPVQAEATIVRPPLAKPLESIRVNGHGPAMHEALASRNSFPAPASNSTDPVAAFQYPSGEQGFW